MTTQGPQKVPQIHQNGPWDVQAELLSFTMEPQGVPGTILNYFLDHVGHFLKPMLAYVGAS